MSGENPSQLVTQFGDQRNKSSETARCPSDFEEMAHLIVQNKRARLDEQSLSVKSHVSHNIRDKFTTDVPENTLNSPHFGPVVATAIEDLLEQTSKIHDIKSPERTRDDKAFRSSNGTILGLDHADVLSVFGLSKHWLSRGFNTVQSKGEENVQVLANPLHRDLSLSPFYRDRCRALPFFVPAI